MTQDEMKQKAISTVQSDFKDIEDANVSKVYENLLGGTLMTVTYKDKGNREMSHVLFYKGAVRVYRYHSDVLTDISYSKERNSFFRFIEFTGIGGLVALILILIFSVLLYGLAFSSRPVDDTIVELVKTSFTTILGFFFGSQVAKK